MFGGVGGGRGVKSESLCCLVTPVLIKDIQCHV